MAAFAQFVPGFVLLEDYEILDSVDLPDGRCIVRAGVTQRGRAEATEYAFVMRPAAMGKYKGSWLTMRLLPADSKYLGDNGLDPI